MTATLQVLVFFFVYLIKFEVQKEYCHSKNEWLISLILKNLYNYNYYMYVTCYYRKYICVHLHVKLS